MDNVVVATFFTVNVVDAEILRSPPTAKEVARPVGVLVAIPTEFVVLNVPITVEDALEINPPVPTPLSADSPNLERPVTLNAAPAVDEADDTKPAKVERPSAVNVPPTRNVVPTLEDAWETNPPVNVPSPVSVEAPETVSAPPVVILVLMVVAAYPTNATAITAATTEKNTEVYFCMKLVNLVFNNKNLIIK